MEMNRLQTMPEPTYYIRSEGQIRGPLTTAQLRALREQGGLQAGDELSTDHVLWDRVSDRPDLFTPDAGITAPAPPQPPGNAASAPPMVQLVDDGLAPSPRPARRNRLPDQYDDEYEDVPRPQSSSGSGLIIGLIIFAAVGLVVVGVVCYAAVKYFGQRASMTFSGVAQTLPGLDGDNFRLNHANYERIKVGMTYQELVTIFGLPTKDVRRGDTRTLTWQSDNKEIVVRLDWPANVVKATDDGKPDKSSPTWD
jgi:hypothetical protein